MPYRKTTKKNSIYQYPRRQLYWAAGKQLARDVTYLKSIVNAECKSHERTGIVYADDAGELFHVSNIALGDTHETRDGDVILPRYLTLKYLIKKSTNGQAPNVELLRMVLFIWHNNTTPLVAGVLESADVMSFYQRVTSGAKGDSREFTILSDKKITLDKDNRQIRYMQLNKQLNRNGVEKRVGAARRSMHIKYNGTNTTEEMNGIYLLIIAETPTGVSDDVKTEVEVHSSLKYYDN